MGHRVLVGTIDEVTPGRGKVIHCSGREIAIFSIGGQFHALDNLCPHKEAPLEAGLLVQEAGQDWLVCPWHRFLFDPCTGKCDRPGFDTRVYPLSVEAGQIYVEV